LTGTEGSLSRKSASQLQEIFQSRQVAKVRLPSGIVHKAELHWYEAHGIGKKKMKIKRFLD